MSEWEIAVVGSLAAGHVQRVMLLNHLKKQSMNDHCCPLISHFTRNSTIHSYLSLQIPLLVRSWANCVTMFEISGNLHISLANISSIHGSSDNTIHITSVISSPDINLHTPYSELSKFHIILQSCSPEPPSFLFEEDVEIFFIGQITASTVGGYPTITVGSGKWVLHHGRHIELVEEYYKAQVWGSGYVVGVNYNGTARWRSYLKVQDFSPKKVCCLINCLFRPMWSSDN